MLGTIVYLVVFALVLWVAFNIFKNWKTIVALGLACVCAYFIVNYAMKDKDLSDKNVKSKWSIAMKKWSNFNTALGETMDNFDEDNANSCTYGVIPKEEFERR